MQACRMQRHGDAADAAGPGDATGPAARRWTPRSAPSRAAASPAPAALSSPGQGPQRRHRGDVPVGAAEGAAAATAAGVVALPR